MKGIRMALVGVCLGLLGIVMQPNVSPIAVGCALAGVAVSIIGCFVKEK